MIFRRRSVEHPDLVVKGDRFTLRPPRMEDFEGWAEVRSSSRAFLQPWEPTWPDDDLTLAAFRRRIKRYTGEIEKDEAYPFLIFSNTNGAVLGGLNLTNIRRGAASMASLGYWMGQANAGKGTMTAAVRAIIPFAAGRLRLRRIEASCVPENQASLRILEKAQFLREGYAPEYLCINGQWRDHILFARQTTPTEKLRA
jgi:[ribosomal protein S5]-alanine N-acetyltransferase